MSVSIEGLDKAEVLAALYNASRPQGMGFMHYDDKPMTAEMARPLVGQGYFDYLQGRVMKIDLTSDTEIDPYLYDRDNGAGACAAAIEAVRKLSDVNAASIQAQHYVGKTEAAQMARDSMEQEPTVKPGEFEITLKDVADTLRPYIDKAVNDDAD